MYKRQFKRRRADHAKRTYHKRLQHCIPVRAVSYPHLDVYKRQAGSRTRYAENAPVLRLFPFSPLMGVSTSAVSKAKIHPRRRHFQCYAVLSLSLIHIFFGLSRAYAFKTYLAARQSLRKQRHIRADHSCYLCIAARCCLLYTS